MLTGVPTKFGAGLQIQGDYYDFVSLYKTIHFIADKLSEGEESNLILSFAYDVRKAKDGQREVIEMMNVFHFGSNKKKQVIEELEEQAKTFNCNVLNLRIFSDKIDESKWKW